MDERSRRVQKQFEWPVIIAALLTIPTLVIQESHFGQPWHAVSVVLNWATWAVFLSEFAVMMWLVPRRRVWLRSHIIDVAVVFLTPPFAPAAWQAARVFRLARLLRLVRVFSVRRLLSLDGIKYAALIAALTVVVGGAAFASIETHEGHVLTTWDGIWWAVTTVTTVGYGDIAPETDGGRIIAMMIMLVGIGFVALLTAFVADRFISEQKVTESKEDEILDELRKINERLDSLERVDAV